MTDIYMLQNNLKKHPRRGCTFIQDINPPYILQKINSKYGHFDTL